MSLPNDSGANGATPRTDRTAIDAELDGSSRLSRRQRRNTIGPYNEATGFGCAMVAESGGKFAIAVRGTDTSTSGEPTAVFDYLGDTPSTTAGRPTNLL